MKRLLVAGYGDIARRAVPLLGSRFEIRALARANGMDLDRPESLAALESADAVLHCAPPPPSGATDTRTANLLSALESRWILPTRFVCISTGGVYGDCGGAPARGLLSFMNESRRLDNARLKRKLGARLRYPTVREGMEGWS